MSYKSNELEQAYDRLEDQYWELVKFIHERDDALLKAFINRNKHEDEDA
jgi:hypothetical protein